MMDCYNTVRRLLLPGIVIGILSIPVVICVVVFTPNIRKRMEYRQTVAALRNLPHHRMGPATDAFASQRRASESAVLAEVSLRELVAGGYLKPDDIRGLEDKDVTVSLLADETTPQVVWVRVRATDGDIAMMADGSILKLPKK